MDRAGEVSVILREEEREAKKEGREADQFQPNERKHSGQKYQDKVKQSKTRNVALVSCAQAPHRTLTHRTNSHGTPNHMTWFSQEPSLIVHT